MSWPGLSIWPFRLTPNLQTLTLAETGHRGALRSESSFASLSSAEPRGGGVF